MHAFLKITRMRGIVKLRTATSHTFLGTRIGRYQGISRLFFDGYGPDVDIDQAPRELFAPPAHFDATSSRSFIGEHVSNATTTRPVRRNAERDAEIVRRYEAGEATLEELADEYHVARQRIGQIISAAGVDGRAVQSSRSAAQAMERSAEVEGLADELQPVVAALAAMELSRAEIVDRLSIFHSDLSGDDLDAVLDVLRGRGIRMNRVRHQAGMSDAAIRAGLLFAVAAQSDRAEPSESAETELDQDIVAGVASALAGEDLDLVAQVLKQVQAGLEIIREDPSSTLSSSRYDSIRSQFLADHQIESGRGLTPWPVGTLTVAKRLGGSWNSALTSVGLATSTAPDGFGLAQYSADDYETALRDFLAQATPDRSSYADYEQWVEREGSSGRSRPSAPAVRGVYRTWNRAVRSAGARDRIDRVTERRQRDLQRSDSTSSELIRAQEDVIADIESELETGTLTDEQKSDLEQRRILAAATIERYKKEDERWKESGKQSLRQFRINLTLAIVVGVGSFAMPVIVWILQTFGPTRP